MTKETIYRLCCLAHKTAKTVLQGKAQKRDFRMVSIVDEDFTQNNDIVINGSFINEQALSSPTHFDRSQNFPIENIVEAGSNLHHFDTYDVYTKKTLKIGINAKNALSAWHSFIKASRIPDPYRNSGLHYAGYIADNINQWCLPSWIWTNAALVRLYCNNGDIRKATEIANILKTQQLECGGWNVRNDYTAEGAIPMLAPNDSAYIANNAFVCLYKVSNNEQYLETAKKCADWIIETARPDGLVWTCYDLKHERWIKKHVIVDTGFTAGLFANLYEITQDRKYKVFLESFISQYVKLFFIQSKNGFSTSIDEFGKQNSGMFARGQAWALEGLIPAYRVLKTKTIKDVIEKTIGNLIQKQLQNGGWAYNLTRPYYGEDCKAVPVIAKSLMEWHRITHSPETFNSSQKALNWILNHTSTEGDSMGGIFSFCLEGSIVHNLYTQTALVYSSAYAIELYIMLHNDDNNFDKRS